MHRPIEEQGLHLKQVMNGYFNYFAVPTNSGAINAFLLPCHLVLVSRAPAAKPDWPNDLAKRMKR